MTMKSWAPRKATVLTNHARFLSVFVNGGKAQKTSKLQNDLDEIKGLAPKGRWWRFITLSLAVMISIVVMSSTVDAASRIKDLADMEGVRDNMLVGYGLVVGLNGTGDSLTNATFTKQSLEAMLERLGVNTRGSNMKTDNVAAVMVTAVLPPFAQHGSRIDVNVSAMGDSESLAGGMLLVTPLMGADGEVYSVAQGRIAIGGFVAGGDASSVTQGIPTGGRIASGGIVEREIPFNLGSQRTMRLNLRNPDFTTARRMAQAINDAVGPGTAVMIDSANVKLELSETYNGNIVNLVTDIEQLLIEPDQPARVVINEKSGIIVIGKDVKVSKVAIAQGNLTVRVTETPQVSQPNAFSETGETAVVPRSEIEIDDGSDRRLQVVAGGVALEDLVAGLNALGVGPRDMISILQAIRASGALQAEIEVM